MLSRFRVISNRSNGSTRFLFPGRARFSAIRTPPGNFGLTEASVAVTDSWITDLRARLLEQLKNSLKVRASSMFPRKKWS